MIYITNAFSLNMLGDMDMCEGCTLEIDRYSDINASAEMRIAQNIGLAIKSVVGHADTARVMSGILGVDVPHHRESVTLKDGDSVLVGQYVGERLPEGATELPEGATIAWFWVQISRGES